MTKRTTATLWIITVVILAAAGVLGFVINQKPERTATRVNQSTKSEPATQQPSTTPATESPPSAGAYIDYNDESFSATKDSRRILFFHAPWCPQCRALDTAIRNQSLPKGITILKVDYDTNQSLRQKYGVTLQTTFVEVDAKNTKLASYVGYESPTYDALRQGLIDK